MPAFASHQIGPRERRADDFEQLPGDVGHGRGGRVRVPYDLLVPRLHAAFGGQRCASLRSRVVSQRLDQIFDLALSS